MTTDDRPTFDPCEALPVKAAAALIHVSEPTLRAIIRRGELPSLMIGRCRRIRRADLAAFLAGRVRDGWAPPRPGAADEGGEEPPLPGEEIGF